MGILPAICGAGYKLREVRILDARGRKSADSGRTFSTECCEAALQAWAEGTLRSRCFALWKAELSVFLATVSAASKRMLPASGSRSIGPLRGTSTWL